MKLSLIVENKTYRENILAEHGLALLIETDEKIILFDSGASDALIINSNEMDIDLSKVDLAILSHGHYDHSGGFPYFNKINPLANIYLQKNAFKQTFDIDKKGKPTEQNLGIRWADEEKIGLTPNLVFTDEPGYITDDIIISGSIPKHMRETRSGQFLEKSGDEYVFDKMEHEQFLIIREKGDLYIFAGCCHNGVAPVINYTKKLFPDEKIKLLFGGFHLYELSGDKLSDEVRKIANLDVDYFIPVHCTGINAIVMMKELLGDRCIILNAGMNYTLTLE